VNRFVLLLACGGLAACQDNIKTPFPAGLEPLEDNRVAPEPDGPFDEQLRIESSNTDMIRVYARGFVQVPFDDMWTVAKMPEPNISTCATSDHMVTPDNEAQYEASFLIHYIVNDFVTVEWDDQWRGGQISPELAILKHQKTQGSDFIKLSEGTIELLTTSDPSVTELAFVEHLDAVQASTSDVVQGVQHNYDALVATAHGNPIPRCP
jgi:hypothetical protein